MDDRPSSPTGHLPGPRPAAPTPITVTPAQGEVLVQLGEHTEPVTVGALAAELGQHSNTVREHLDALVRLGLAERRQLPSAGRGRPAYGYATAADRLAPRAYLAVIEALAGHLEASSPMPAAAAEQLGREYAARLAPGPPVRQRAPERRAVATVAVLMTELGFVGELDRQRALARITRCPLAAAVESHREIVCGFHQGMVHGVSDRLAPEHVTVELLPMAQPGACLLSAAATD